MAPYPLLHPRNGQDSSPHPTPSLIFNSMHTYNPLLPSLHMNPASPKTQFRVVYIFSWVSPTRSPTFNVSGGVSQNPGSQPCDPHPRNVRRHLQHPWGCHPLLPPEAHPGRGVRPSMSFCLQAHTGSHSFHRTTTGPLVPCGPHPSALWATP